MGVLTVGCDLWFASSCFRLILESSVQMPLDIFKNVLVPLHSKFCSNSFDNLRMIRNLIK